MRASVVIVIIAHKSELSDNEKASLRQCYKILGKYPIKLICPEGLDVSVYKEINPKADVVFIDPKWQSSYRMFNELKKSPLLYEMFRNFEYMLFYELDAWVFRDELEYWCNKGYDYIGAPWFEGWHDAGPDSSIIGVGNGGFSLRNIKKTIAILNRIKKIELLRKIYYSSKLQAFIPFRKVAKILPFSLKSEMKQNLSRLLNKGFNVNEDFFWCQIVPSFFDDFVIATDRKAFKFSFDANPSLCFSKNNKKLPFGCHAWERYEPGFWKEFILFKPL